MGGYKSLLKIDNRLKVIILGTITSAIPRALGFIYTLMIIPLVINLLGKEALGVWLTIVSIIELLNFADFGVTNNLINKVSEASINKDEQKEKEIISSSFFIILLFGFLIGCLYLFIREYVDWSNILGIKNQRLLQESVTSLNILIGYFIINFPLVIYQKVRYAIQERQYLNYYEGVGKALSIVLVLIGIFYQFRLPNLILMFIIGPIVGQLLNTIMLLHKKRHYIPSMKKVSGTAIKDIFSTSQYFFLINVCYLFYTSLDNLLISSLINAAEVAKYASISRVYLVFPMVIALITPSLWVANREAFIMKDFNWIRELFKKSNIIILSSSVILFGASFILNERFFEWFTGGSIAFDQELVMIVALNAVTIIAYNLISSFFIAIDEVKIFALIFSVFSFLAFVAKYKLLGQYGLTFAYGINFILFVLLFFTPSVFYLKRKLKNYD